jgi:hypothetical protein
LVPEATSAISKERSFSGMEIYETYSEILVFLDFEIEILEKLLDQITDSLIRLEPTKKATQRETEQELILKALYELRIAKERKLRYQKEFLKDFPLSEEQDS